MSKSKLKSTLKQIGALANEAISAEASEDATNPTDWPVKEKELAHVLAPRKQDADYQAEQHMYNGSTICATDSRGHSEPEGRTRLVVDATHGFIPLWASDVTLRWRFNEPSLMYFQDPAAAQRALRFLFNRAVEAWGDAAPVRFVESHDPWDFEIFMMRFNDCDANGCVLASAFFPDGGRHRLRIYPKMFEQPRSEWIETLCHEVGHIFGLRHFFAQVNEATWPSHVFGTHSPFSIMNYGAQSVLTETDKSDLKSLYQLARSGEMTSINGTPIRLFTPYSESGVRPGRIAALQS